MNFLGLLLFPFTLLYDAITRFRNYLYDIGYKRAFSFEANVIAVGNLSVGGTGKSPLVEYLIRLLSDKQVVTLSRGYGRATRGFRMATDEDSPGTIGDEPYQFYTKFDNIQVTVGEQRAMAIPFILAELPETEVILLDDAFQHRPVKPSLNIMLTDYNRPFYNDYVLPSGRLRERRRGAARADVIVMTKCPEDIDIKAIESKIRKYNKTAHIAFTTIQYLEPKKVAGLGSWSDNLFLFSGIANPRPLRNHLAEHYHLVGEHYFNDHHRYTPGDLGLLKEKLAAVDKSEKCLVTTEKDMVKLKDLMEKGGIMDIPVFYIPIQTVFVKGGKRFDKLVLNSLRPYSY